MLLHGGSAHSLFFFSLSPLAADLDHDGSLTADEIMPFMPASTTELERPKWLAIVDRHGAHDVLTIADLPALLRMAQRDERQTIGNASVTMAVFICYIRTAKAIMAMFSTESINGVAYLKEEIGTKAYTPRHLANIAVAAVYGFLFVICIPIGAIYIIFINRSRFKTRKVQAAFGFLFEGCECTGIVLLLFDLGSVPRHPHTHFPFRSFRTDRPKMFFWEFVVMLRKIVVLGVALFWEDAFLQSITALFVLVISIIVHMACWPYEELFLNVAELCSLLCLFTLVAFAVLLWYVQQPGKTDYVVAYELFVSAVIFLAYGGLLIALFTRIIYLEIRERSKVLVEKIPGLLPLFQWFVEAEEWLHFNFTKKELQGQDEMWGFLRTVRIVGEEEKSDGINETKGEKAKRLLARVRPLSKRRLAGGIGRAERDVVPPTTTADAVHSSSGGDRNLSGAHPTDFARHVSVANPLAAGIRTQAEHDAQPGASTMDRIDLDSIVEFNNEHGGGGGGDGDAPLVTEAGVEWREGEDGVLRMKWRSVVRL